MTDRYEEADHVLIVSVSNDDLSWDVLHPETCVVNHDDAFALVVAGPSYDCAISRKEYEWGLSEYTEITEPGIFRLMYWATPASYAMGMAIDADDGIEVEELIPFDNELSIVEHQGVLLAGIVRAVMASLGLTDEQREKTNELLRASLLAIGLSIPSSNYG